MYALIINFWYVFSFFAIISSIFIRRNKDTQIKEFIIGVIPFYYGLFLVFAVHFEFARLMVPIAPFIIYNFLVTISIILEVLKDTYVLFFNPTKKKST
jgi:ABC-type iron transport system FetAB permease component